MNTPTHHCARNGKIARLPESIRAELNQRLRDGQSSNLILPWLNSLPETKDLPKPINKVNLTAWRQGGFAEDSLRILQTQRLKEMTTFAFQLGQASQNPSPVGRRCSAALTSRDHPLTQGAWILATAQLFELLNNNPDLDQLTQIIKSLVTLRRTEISQQNARLREKYLKLREKSKRPIRQSRPNPQYRILDDDEYEYTPHGLGSQVPESSQTLPTPDPTKTPASPSPTTTAPTSTGARTFLSASGAPLPTHENTTPSAETPKSELSPVKVDEAKPAPKKYTPLYDINDFLPKLPGDGLIA